MESGSPLVGGNDRIRGGDGRDFIIGGAGADMLEGGAGNDAIVGDGGLITRSLGVLSIASKDLFTGAGDTLDGGAGFDVLIGNLGGNLFIGSQATDLMIGNYGRIRVLEGAGTQPDQLVSYVTLAQGQLDLIRVAQVNLGSTEPLAMLFVAGVEGLVPAATAGLPPMPQSTDGPAQDSWAFRPWREDFGAAQDAEERFGMSAPGGMPSLPVVPAR
ncbi:MAG: hypothetical protein MUF53_06540, partial [Gemmatimonadaceae bacterium]|nr:hypothetical protein [Gemmatimonadaceae bacterium]